MKATTAAALINVAMWIGVSAAIIVALVITSRISVLWFYIIPALSGYSTRTTSNKGESEEEGE